MAADVKTAKIFTKPDGSSLIFFMRPCAERQSIRPLINEHGGKVTSNAATGCIKLAEKGSKVTEDGYLSSRFLKACVKQNKLLDVSDFRIKPGTTAPGDSSDEECESDYSLSPADEIKQRPVEQIKGRNKYTKEEDIAIIRHLITENVYSDAQGMKIWKQMEFLKVTNHTAQSMNTRYRKHILPNIQQYVKDIDRSWISKLTGIIIPPSNTSFDVDDMFKGKSPRMPDNKESSSTKASSKQASSKPGKKLYQQLEFVVLDKNKTDMEEISSYFPCPVKNANNTKEMNTNSECNSKNLHLGLTKNLDSRHKGKEKSPSKKLILGNNTQNGTVTREEKVKNDSDIAKSATDTDESPTRNISLRDRACDRNEMNTRHGMKKKNDHDKAKTRSDSGSDCNIVSSSIELIETHVQLSETEGQSNSQSDRQKSGDHGKFINLKRKNNDDNRVSNLKRRTLRSKALQNNDNVSVEENRKRKKSNATISNSLEDKIDPQVKVKRLHLGEEPKSSEVQNNESLEVNTDTIVVNSQDDFPDIDMIDNTPGDDDRTGHEIINTKNTKRTTGISHILNKTKSGSKNGESTVDVETRTASKQEVNQENFDDSSVDKIISSIDDILDSQRETSGIGQTPESFEVGDETMESEDGAGCSQGSSHLLKMGPQTSTPKANPSDDDGLIELDVNCIEDCRAICKSIAERYDLQYETVRLFLYGCNGNIKRALSYINYGPHSFFPPPWSMRDDGLLEDHRNVPSLIVKYGAKEVQERLLFLEELL